MDSPIERAVVAARYLLDRLTGPRARADQLVALRRRWVSQKKAEKPSPAGERLARQLRELRERLATQLGHVEVCARCGDPASRVWRGGQCCSARTQELFSDSELAALRLSGTTPGRLRPPRGPHAGCAFRGPTGCSLAAAHRPCVCVGYVCRELWVELRRRGDAAAVARLQDELQRVFQRFVAERESTRQAALFHELETGLHAWSRRD